MTISHDLDTRAEVQDLIDVSRIPPDPPREGNIIFVPRNAQHVRKHAMRSENLLPQKARDKTTPSDGVTAPTEDRGGPRTTRQNKEKQTVVLVVSSFGMYVSPGGQSAGARAGARAGAPGGQSAEGGVQAQLEQAWHEQPRGRARQYCIPVAESEGERGRWGGPTASLWFGGSRLGVEMKQDSKRQRRKAGRQEGTTDGRGGHRLINFRQRMCGTPTEEVNTYCAMTEPTYRARAGVRILDNLYYSPPRVIPQGHQTQLLPRIKTDRHRQSRDLNVNISTAA